MITVYTLAYEEEVMIQFMIDHYRQRFPGCRIVVHINKQSQDQTIKIAEKNGCELVFDNIQELRDEPLTEIKNNCWKEAKTDWVVVCDMDELLDINQSQLQKEESSGTTIIRSRGYDMVEMGDKLDLAAMNYGARAVAGDKAYLFNKKYIKEVNYSPGAHRSNPLGIVNFSQKAYKAYHYCYINYDQTVQRYKLARARVTPGLTFYEETPEQIWDLYRKARAKAVKVR